MDRFPQPLQPGVQTNDPQTSVGGGMPSVSFPLRRFAESPAASPQMKAGLGAVGDLMDLFTSVFAWGLSGGKTKLPLPERFGSWDNPHMAQPGQPAQQPQSGLRLPTPGGAMQAPAPAASAPSVSPFSGSGSVSLSPYSREPSGITKLFQGGIYG